MTIGLTDRLLARATILCAIVLVGILPLPLIMGFANGSYLAVLAVSLLLWGALTVLQEPADRITFVRIAVVAVAVRVAAHLAVFAWATSGGGPYLGPDSTMYFRESQVLADRAFEIDGTPALYFRSWDSAHFYLFAAARRWLNADLYGLQTMNACLSALAGPLFFSMWRTLGLRHAVLLGLGVAVYPSLVALSINDMLKDPSILGAATIGVWSLVRLTQPRTPAVTAALIVVGTAALAYTRMSRFYVVAFLEVAVLAAIAIRWLLGSSANSPRRSPVTAILTVLLLVEVVPMLAGWPSNPRLLAGAVSHTLDTPLMRNYASGLVDYVRTARAESEPTEQAAARPGVVMDDGRATRIVKGQVISEPMPALPVQAPAATPGAVDVKPSLAARVVSLAVNGVRKLLGPFPWVGPPAWTPRVLLLNDYLLFPGMLVWYAVFPVAVIGLGVVGLRALRGMTLPAPIIALGIFASLLMLQYLALNLSYRQREFMVPFLAGAALVALQYGPFPRIWRYAYGVYWLLLVVMAVAHLSIRSAMS